MAEIRIRFRQRTPFAHRIWAHGAETYVSAAELAELGAAVEVVPEPVPSEVPARDLSRVGVRDRLQRLIHGPWRPFFKR